MDCVDKKPLFVYYSPFFRFFTTHTQREQNMFRNEKEKKVIALKRRALLLAGRQFPAQNTDPENMLSKAELITCGDACYQKARYGDALSAYAKALANEKVVELGTNLANTALAEMIVTPAHQCALACFRFSNETNQARLLGTKYFTGAQNATRPNTQKEFIRFARLCFACSNDTEKLVELGRFAEDKNHGAEALDCFKDAGATTEINGLAENYFALQAGEKAVDNSPIFLALNAFKEIKNRDGLQRCAEWLIRYGWKNRLIEQIKAGLKIITDNLLELPSRMIEEMLTDFADSSVESIPNESNFTALAITVAEAMIILETNASSSEKS